MAAGHRLPDGSRTDATRFWVEVRARAAELITDRPVVPGVDYALTEAVRCKSHDEIGVEEALATCSDRYLRTTLVASVALVVVVLGRLAARAVEAEVRVSRRKAFHDRVLVGGRSRFVVFLPHPNARMARSFSDRLSADELGVLRDALAARDDGSGASSPPRADPGTETP